jgi:hypothetical protein
MPAIRFECRTSSKVSHEDIRRRIFLAGGAIVREKIYKDTSSEFQGYFEILSEGGTLYREVKELGLSHSVNIIN